MIDYHPNFNVLSTVLNVSVSGISNLYNRRFLDGHCGRVGKVAEFQGS